MFLDSRNNFNTNPRCFLRFRSASYGRCGVHLFIHRSVYLYALLTNRRFFKINRRKTTIRKRYAKSNARAIEAPCHSFSNRKQETLMSVAPQTIFRKKTVHILPRLVRTWLIIQSGPTNSDARQYMTKILAPAEKSGP